MTSFIVTGSATADGSPIYMTRDGEWTRRIVGAAQLGTEDQRERMLAQARGNQFTICDPYVIEVLVSGEDVLPATLRERIRAAGPTVAYGP